MASDAGARTAKADGRSAGDAYAVFDTEEAAVEALQFDKQKLGTRW